MKGKSQITKWVLNNVCKYVAVSFQLNGCLDEDNPLQQENEILRKQIESLKVCCLQGMLKVVYTEI